MNEQRNNYYRSNQCFVRTQSISNRKGKETTYQFINAMMKADPNKKGQREKLMQALQTLNNKLEFGIEITLPSS